MVHNLSFLDLWPLLEGANLRNEWLLKIRKITNPQIYDFFFFSPVVSKQEKSLYKRNHISQHTMSSSFQRKCERRQEKLVSELNIVYGKNQKRRKKQIQLGMKFYPSWFWLHHIFKWNSFTNAALKLGLPLNFVLHCQLKSLLFSFERIFFFQSCSLLFLLFSYRDSTFIVRS